MQYALFLYDDETSWVSLSEAEQMAVVEQHGAYVDALRRADAFVSGEPLEVSGTARCLRAGKVQDGPYADTKEQLGGFYVIRADSMEAALDWARQCPISPSGMIEVRPVPDYGG